MTHGLLYNRNFLIDGVNCEYCGRVLVGGGSHEWNCVVIKVANISRINNWDSGGSGLKGYSYDLLKNYGIEFTDYGKELVRESGNILWPATFSNGKMTHELSRYDFEPQYQQIYDTTKANGGGYVVLSPLVSMLYTTGNIFKK